MRYSKVDMFFLNAILVIILVAGIALNGYLTISGFIYLYHQGQEEMYYDITQEEREMLARLTYLEAGSCGSQCQRAVVSAIFNRLEAKYWGDTLKEVIYYPNAFSPAYLIDTSEQPPQEIYDAVDYVLENGPTIPPEVRYFRADYDFSWEGYAHYATYDNVYFGYFTNGDH